MPWRRLAVVVLVSLGGTTARAAQRAAPDSDLARRVREYIAPYVRAGNFSGSILAGDHGRIVLNAGFGLADPEHGIPNGPGTRFHIASVSKTFTAAAILLLAEDGRLALTDPLGRFVPDFPSGERITIHNLLTHTSGIGDVNRSRGYAAASLHPQTTESLLELARSMPVAFKDSTAYSYSNTNYNILAYIIERVSGTSYGAFLASRLFGPLGLRSTLHHADASAIIPDAAVGLIPGPAPRLVAKAPYLDWSVKTGNGSLVSTTTDLFHWAEALTSGTILDSASRRLTFTPHAGNMGYGWFIRQRLGRIAYYMNGNSPGFSSCVMVFPQDAKIVVVLENNDIPLATSVATDVAALMLHEASGAYPWPAAPSPPLAELQRLAGRYVSTDAFPGTLDLVLHDGQLFARSSYPTYDVPLTPLGTDRWLHRFYWSAYTVERNARGEVTGLRADGAEGARWKRQ